MFFSANINNCLFQQKDCLIVYIEQFLKCKYKQPVSWHYFVSVKPKFMALIMQTLIQNYMKLLRFITIYIIVLMISLIGFTRNVKAQETMIPDISYLFLEKIIATAKTNYPLLKQLDIKEKVEEYNIKNTKLSWLTPVNVLYLSQPSNVVSLVDPRFFSGVQLGVNINFAQILQTPNNVKIAKQQLELARETSNQYESTIEVQIKTRYFAYIQQLNAVKLFTKSLQDAEGLVQSLRLKYERGEVEFRDYSEALINFSSLSKQKLEAEAGYLTAKASIEELTITKLEDIK